MTLVPTIEHPPPQRHQPTPRRPSQCGRCWSSTSPSVGSVGPEVPGHRRGLVRPTSVVPRPHDRRPRALSAPSPRRVLPTAAPCEVSREPASAVTPWWEAGASIEVSGAVALAGGYQRRSKACHQPGGGVPLCHLRSALNHHVDLSSPIVHPTVPVGAPARPRAVSLAECASSPPTYGSPSTPTTAIARPNRRGTPPPACMA